MESTVSGFCGTWVFLLLVLLPIVVALRPLRERNVGTLGGLSSMSLWPDEIYYRQDKRKVDSNSPWNITGTYKGTWRFTKNSNESSRFSDFGISSGVSVFELVTATTKISGVHYVQGAVLFHDIFGNENDLVVAPMRVEGVYIRPFRQVRLVINGRTDSEAGEEAYFSSHPYHLLRFFPSRVFQGASKDVVERREKSLSYQGVKHCNLDISAKVSQISSKMNDQELYHLEGVMETPAVDGDGECFSPIEINSTSFSVEVYFNKIVNYTLMVTFASFLQVLLLIRQMEYSNTQSGAAKVCILMIGQQAIMDAYLCLLHLTAGILVESVFNAFATASFFKFVAFSIFEMRYVVAIWKATRLGNAGDSWQPLRTELSGLYRRFYGILLGGLLIMYFFRTFLRTILIVMYSFWIPQIISNIMYDTRKPLHHHYVVGVTITRLAIPFYMFGCETNFMGIKVETSFCVVMGSFLGFQAVILLLQHNLGSRWFIPQQFLPDKYSYHRKIRNDTNETMDCVICMTPTHYSTQRTTRFMVTPCEHLFHTGCLEKWMDVKMECPTCRRSLPPV